MLQTLTDIRFGEGTSPIHRLDPRAKVLLLAIVAAGTLGRGGGPAAWPLWALLFLGVLASRVGVGYFLRGLKYLFWLVAAGILLHGLSTPGVNLLRHNALGVRLTAGGLSAGLRISAQLALTAAFARLLLLTTSPANLLNGLGRMMEPFEKTGIPVKNFFLSVLMALEIFPLLKGELEGLGKAAPMGQGWFRRRLNAAETLIRRVLRRSDQLLQKDRVPETVSAPKDFGTAEWALLALFIAASAAPSIVGMPP